MAAKEKPGGGGGAKLRLHIELPDGYEPAETEPGEPITFLNESAGSAFQLSMHLGAAEGENWGDAELIEFAADTGRETEGVEPAQTYADACEMGRCGSAVFSTPERPISQIWYLSNGTHVLVATLICSAPPDQQHLESVWETVHGLNLVPA